MIWHCDFETRSRKKFGRSKESVGIWRYAEDPSTVPLCFAYSVDWAPPQLWIPKYDEIDFSTLPDEIHAWNVEFEKAIWRMVMVPRYGWPDLPDHVWKCTAATARLYSLPGALGDCAVALGLSERKDKEGHNAMMKMSKPRKPTKNNPREWFDDPHLYQSLFRYCLQDVVVEQQIEKAIPPMTEFERPIFELDAKINARGIPVDIESLKGACRIEQKLNHELCRELATITGGEVTTGSQHARLLKFLNNNGVNTGSTDKDAIVAILADPDLPSVPKRVCEIRQALGRASTAKLVKMLITACADGRVRGTHLYCGAHTRRWSGRLAQFQNLVRACFDQSEFDYAFSAIRRQDVAALERMFDSVTDALVKAVRSMVCAPEGKMLAITDFDQIEARVSAWFAGEKWLVELFANGDPFYEVTAAKIYAMAVEDVGKDSLERFVGKTASLGLQYQMGARTFQASCLKFGVDLDLEFCQDVVDKYRAMNGNIKQHWYDLEEAAIRTVQTRKPHRAGKIIFNMHKGFLFLNLPSGGRLAYFRPEVKKALTPWGRKKWQLSYMVKDSTKAHQFKRNPTYGGKIFENQVQAFSRDVEAFAMLRSEDHGWPVAFHVHDEVINEVDEGFDQVDELQAVLSEVPDWAEGCPISAGTPTLSKRYLKG